MRESSGPEVSLVLPCYNERDNIAGVLAGAIGALERLGRSWEILVVDNHSGDGTPEVVRAVAAGEPRVRLIVHDSNRLYSGSCRTALRESRGRYVAVMDSDGQFSADDLPRFLERLEGGANLVFGWRKRRHDPVARKALSLVFNLLARLWLRYPFHDLNVGLRMFDRRFVAAADIRHAINMANPELYVRARQAGLALAEVPVRHAARAKGQTSHNFRKLFRLFLTVNRYFQELKKDLDAARRRPRAGGAAPGPLRPGQPGQAAGPGPARLPPRREGPEVRDPRLKRDEGAGQVPGPAPAVRLLRRLRERRRLGRQARALTRPRGSP
jgi:glycosyltransferase involved in cell wall biosynthesis